MMKLVNVTPHRVVITGFGSGVNYGETREICVEPEAEPARLAEISEDLPNLANNDNEWPDGVQFGVRRVRFSGIYGLPEPAEGTIYIASMAVAAEAARLGREDVYSPDSSRAMRKDGFVQSVPSLVSWK